MDKGISLFKLLIGLWDLKKLKKDEDITLQKFLELSRLKLNEETWKYYASMDGKPEHSFWDIDAGYVWENQKKKTLKYLLREIIRYMETYWHGFYRLQMSGFDVGAKNPITRDILDS